MTELEYLIRFGDEDKACARIASEIKLLEDQIHYMKQCLFFYADPCNWEKDNKILLEVDKGQFADKTIKLINDLSKRRLS